MGTVNELRKQVELLMGKIAEAEKAEYKQAVATKEQPKVVKTGKLDSATLKRLAKFSADSCVNPFGYGKSVVATKDNKGDYDGLNCHAARLKQLEAAIPGIASGSVSTMANIFSVGKNQKGEKTKTLSKIVNRPWTWVELPKGKNYKVGNLKPEEIRRRLKACGYSYSSGNGMWATRGDGGGGSGRGKCNKVGRDFRDADE